MGQIVSAKAGRVGASILSVFLLVSVPLLADLMLAPSAAASAASSVSTPAVTIAPTAAVGARTGYTVVFKTSASGGLSGAAGNTVSMTFPSGTKVNTLTSAYLTDTTTNKVVGQANNSSTTSLSFFLYSSAVVNGGDTVSAAVMGAVSPASPGTSYKVTVSTTKDTTPVASTPYTLVAGHPISKPTVTVAPTAAAGARTGYTVVFATSSTGGMSGAVASTISMSFPSGTNVNTLTSAYLTDTTTNKVVGQANNSSTTSLSFFLYSSAVINAGDTVSAAVMGAVSPASPGTAYTVSASTTSDTTSVTSSTYTLVAKNPISKPTVTVAPTAAAGARTGYTVVFKTSTTGGMSGAVASTISMTFPSGTNVNTLTSAYLTDTTTNKVVGQANNSSTTSLSFFLYSSAVINAGDTVSAAVMGAVSPASPGTAYTVSASTTSDTTSVTSSTYTLVAKNPISKPTVTVAPTAAAGARTGYTVVFATSSTGGMSGAVASTISMTFPSGTNVNTLTSAYLTDTTTNKVVGQANNSTTTSLSFFLYSSAVINAGDTVSAAVMGAVSPASPGTAYTVSASTTSDTTSVTSSTYTLVAGNHVSTPTVTPSDHTPGATGVTYTAVLKTSTTGAMSGAVGSTVSVTFPAGTKLNTFTSAVLTDSTTAKAVGQANQSTTTSLSFYLYSSAVINAGDTLSVAIQGAGNPTTSSSTDIVTVSTTSDTTPMPSCPYYIGSGPAAPCVTSVNPTSGPAGGGTKVTIVGLNFTGATQVTFGAALATGVVVNGAGTSITATAPAGSGTVDVTVTTPAGTSPKSPADRYTYVPPPTITTTSLASGSVAVAYSATVTAIGGKKPYKWSISVGSLPPGLTIAASTGVISGTPTTSGTYSFTVMVTDSENPKASATKGLSITIN